MKPASLRTTAALQTGRELSEMERTYRELLRCEPRNDKAMYMLGVVAMETGRNAQAVQWFNKALKISSREPEYHHAIGRVLKAGGEVDRAIKCFERALSIQPELPNVLVSLGGARKVKGDAEGAIEAFERALDFAPEHPVALLSLADLLREQGRHELAVINYRAALRFAPNNAPAHCSLGISLEELGQVDDAVACYEEARRLHRNHFESNARLGRHLHRLGRLAEAIEAYRRALVVDPDNADLLYRAAAALNATDRAREASSLAARAFGLAPAQADLHYELGLALAQDGAAELAEASFRRALELRQNDSDCLNKLGFMIERQGRFSEALAIYRRVVSLDPMDKDAWLNLASVYQLLGQLEESLRCCDRAIDLDPNWNEAISTRLLALNYSPAVTQDELTAAHRDYGARRKVKSAGAQELRNPNEPHRRLRVGLVSPDLRQHSIAYFIEALFTHLDRTQFALWCYHLKPISDAYTLRFQERSEGWRQVHRVSGETLVETVRTDGIDILIDLAGHTDRMIAVFNRRLAPVQVTWLGYPTTSGAAEMDYRISDPEVDPAGRDGLCTEKLMRITPSYYCYSPFETPSPAASTPSMTHGSVTLGSFNNLLKISDFVLSLWGQICRELPEARLVLKHASTRAPETLAALTQRAVGAGIPPERLILADWSPSRQRHLEAYKDVDIALDSAPYNGATTTCESLWMGVPVVTLSGETHAGRMGRSILTAAGLPELVARTPDEYVRRVVALARDVDRLNDYRRELRSRVSASPLMDGKAFVSSLEGALREAWRLWCAGEAPRDIGGPGTSAVFEASGGRST